jgi:BirA family transcriptional regulator, biotin operon repressor / biotin---[acetyl-CoA-carboxylase] ligase
MSEHPHDPHSNDLIVWADRVGSTQDMLHAMAADGATDGTAVTAVEQTDGRGSRGRSWRSPRGGLWLSVLSRPQAPMPAEALSIRVALAVAGALERRGVDGVQLKWPNDLILDGRKLGGILSEARWSGDRLGWIAVGVGINVANEVPEELAKTAIALSERLPDARPSELALPVIAAVRAAAVLTGPLTAAERAAFARRDWLAGRGLSSPVVGTAAGIEPDGALRVRRTDGVFESIRVGPAVAVSF